LALDSAAGPVVEQASAMLTQAARIFTFIVFRPVKFAFPACGSLSLDPAVFGGSKTDMG
jgi:hypothetical protein